MARPLKAIAILSIVTVAASLQGCLAAAAGGGAAAGVAGGYAAHKKGYRAQSPVRSPVRKGSTEDSAPQEESPEYQQQDHFEAEPPPPE